MSWRNAGKSAADGLEIALCLVDMLPSIPLHLTFNTAIADLPGFTPKALTYASLPSTVQDVMTTPGEETLASAPAAQKSRQCNPQGVGRRLTQSL